MSDGASQSPDGGVVPELAPDMALGAPPPFHKLPEFIFQDMCRDLLGVDPGVSGCDIYGTRGQHQHGIDLLAQRRSNDGVDVAQCKCYADFPPRQIRLASDEFFAHWDYWSKQGVKRFVLCVASDLSQRQRQEEILKQKKRFAGLSIEYVVWSSATIRDRLRSQPGIVATYIKPEVYWVQQICGPFNPAAHWASAPNLGAQETVSAIRDLAAELSESVCRELDLARGNWREGRYDDAARWIDSVPSTTLSNLPPRVRARLLRFRASLRLELDRDVTGAKASADSADKLDPEAVEGVRLKAILAAFEADASTGAALLEGRDDIDSQNLYGALRLEAGDPQHIDEVERRFDRLIESGRANFETHRLRAIVAVMRNDLDLAHRMIAAAQQAAPRRESVLQTAAAVHYASSLCGAAPDLIFPWPRPVEWWQVRRDSRSLAALVQAERIVSDLLGRSTTPNYPRQNLEAWQLACLANHPERQVEANTFAASVLKRDPTHTRIIAWALARNLSVSLEHSRSSLEQLVSGGRAEPHNVVALLNLYLKEGRAKDAEALLDESRALLAGAGGGDELWRRWRVLVRLDSKDATEGAESLLAEYEGKHAADLRIFAMELHGSGTEHDARVLDSLHDAFADGGRAEHLFELCRFAALRGRWELVAQWANRLIEVIPTPEAVRLATLGLFNTQAYGECIAVLNRSATYFAGGGIPPALRQILTRCYLAIGRLPEATREATALSQVAPTPANILTLMDLHIRQGDLKACSLIARELVTLPDVPLDRCLLLSRLIQVEDRTLARQLWRRAVGGPVPDELVSEAVSLGGRLATEEDQSTLSALHGRLIQLGRDRRAGVVFVDTEEEVQAFVTQLRESVEANERSYRRSEVPLHVLLPHAGVTLGTLFHSTATRNERASTFANRSPIYARYGARPREVPVPNTRDRRLLLDVTSLLLLRHFGLLARVLGAFNSTIISPDVVPLLVTERALVSAMTNDDQGAWLTELIDELRNEIRSERVSILPVDQGTHPHSGRRRPRRASEASTDSSTVGDAIERCLLNLLEAPTRPDSDIICIDDRFMSRYPFNQGVQIVGIMELLDGLRKQELLNSVDHQSMLGRLRAANVRLLPINEAEVLGCLERASIRDGRVVETQELRTLRSYVAACFLDRADLQMPPLPDRSPVPQGEIEFVLSVHRTAMNTMYRVFERPAAEAIPRAEWLARWLLPGVLILRHVCGTDARQAPDEMVASGLAQLVATPIGRGLTAAERRKQSAYLSWLGTHLQDVFSAQPALRQRVWGDTRSFIDAAFDREDDDEDGIKATQLLLAPFFGALPPVLRDLALSDPVFAQRCGLNVRRTITVGGVDFEEESFWRAAAEAINGRPSSAAPANSSSTAPRVEVRHDQDGEHHGVTFTPPGSTESRYCYLPALEFVHEDEAVRNRSLRRLEAALGLPAEEFAEVVRQVSSPPEVVRRIAVFYEAWSSSSDVFYRGFLQRCQAQEEFPFPEMRPPDAGRLLWHFGLGPAEANIDLAAARVLARDGLGEAIKKLSGIPIALPDVIKAAFAVLERCDRDRLLHELRQSGKSFIAAVRLLELAACIAGEHEDLTRMTMDFLTGEEAAAQFSAFSALLNWVNSDFLRWPQAQSWSRPARLALVWAHTHRLFACLLAGGIDPASFRQQIRRYHVVAPAEIFGQDRAYAQDVANPRTLRWETYLCACLGMVAAEHPQLDLSAWQGRIYERVTYEREGRRGAHLSFFLDTSLPGNELGSFLAADWRMVLSRLLGNEEVAQDLGREATRAAREEAVRRLEADIADVEAWVFLFGICRDYGVDEDLIPRLSTVVLGLDLVSFLRDRPGHWHVPLAVLQNLVSTTQDDGLAQALEAQVVGVCRELQNSSYSPQQRRRVRPFVYEAIHTLSATQSSVEEAIRRFVSVTELLAAIDTSILDDLALFIFRLWRWMPGPAAAWLIPLILRVRRDSGWQPEQSPETVGESDPDEVSDDDDA